VLLSSSGKCNRGDVERLIRQTESAPVIGNRLPCAQIFVDLDAFHGVDVLIFHEPPRRISADWNQYQVKAMIRLSIGEPFGNVLKIGRIAGVTDMEEMKVIGKDCKSSPYGLTNAVQV
jgi:hypothetical protein